MHHVFITMDVVVLNSVFSFMFDVVEQLIILMVDRVLQGSTLVVGHVMAVDVTMVLAVFVNVMSEVLIVCMMNGRLYGCLWPSLVKWLIMNVMVLNSMDCFVFNVMEQLIVLMLYFVFQGSTLVVGHVVAVDVTRVVAVGVNVMSKVLANMVVVVVIKDVITLEGVLGHPPVRVMMNFVCFGFMLPIIWIMLDAVNIVALINVLGVVLTVIYL